MNPEINLNESEKELKSIEFDLWPTIIEEPKNSLNAKDDFDYEKIYKSPTLAVNMSEECLACGS